MKKMIVAGLVFLPSLSMASGYFGASVGLADADYRNLDFEHQTSLSAYAGFDVHDYVALEAKYIDFGEMDYAGGSSSLSITGANFSVVGKRPLSNDVDLYGKVGLFVSDADFKQPTGSFGGSHTDVSFGLGVSFNVAQGFYIDIGYDQYNVEAYRDIEVELKSYTIGAHAVF